MIDDSSSDQTFETARSAGERLGFKQRDRPAHAVQPGLRRQPEARLSPRDRSRASTTSCCCTGTGSTRPSTCRRSCRRSASSEPDALIASRMIDRRGALRGGMPFYKWLGNQILTAIENRMLGSDLSEFHSGYRAYKVEALESIPFRLNSDDFHFDTEILIQLLSTGRTVTEIPVPTFYGDEISRVNGIGVRRELPQGRLEGSPRAGRPLLRAEVRLRRVRRERLSREAGRQHAAPRDPLARVADRLAGRRPRLEPRRPQRAARRARSRTSPRPTSSGRRTPATPRRSRSTSTATSTETLGSRPVRLRARRST